MTDSASITFKTNLAAPYALAEESTGPYIIPVDMDRTELSTVRMTQITRYFAFSSWPSC